MYYSSFNVQYLLCYTWTYSYIMLLLQMKSTCLKYISGEILAAAPLNTERRRYNATMNINAAAIGKGTGSACIAVKQDV